MNIGFHISWYTVPVAEQDRPRLIAPLRPNIHIDTKVTLECTCWEQPDVQSVHNVRLHLCVTTHAAESQKQQVFSMCCTDGAQLVTKLLLVRLVSIQP